jgi:opacity protein-like surface antigen
MYLKNWHLALLILAFAASANALDFGGHVGYFGSDVSKADIGVNAMVPFGIVAISPNIDYTRMSNAGLWFGNADVALRFGANRGTSYWVGAGPTYGYVSNYSTTNNGPYSRRQIGSLQYTPPPSNGPGTPPSNTPSTPHTAFDRFGGSTSAWGWDANAGAAWRATSSLRPYVVGRYNQVRSLKTAGVAIGLRFGH